MKILFSVGNLDENLNANTKIALKVAKALAKMGAECTITGACEKKSLCKDITVGGVTRRRFYINQFKSENKKMADALNSSASTFNKLKFGVIHPTMFLKLLWQKVKTPTSAYKKNIKKLLEEKQFDVIVCVYIPFEFCEAVINIKNLPCPVVAYQLDPWGENTANSWQRRSFVVNKECRVFEKCKHIFTTPVLLKSYLKNEYQPYTSKMTPLEFPVLQKPAFNSGTQSAVEFDENYTNMVFCGAVVDTFRSPKAFLEVFENALKENPNMRIYFVGTNHSGVLNGFIKRLPNNIFATGLVPNSVAMETMKQADFLVNIGNGIENQVPSKIFEYFSYGKPTITTIKMKNCPSISYFERYGNALILDEKTRASTNAIDFLEFVKNNKGKEIGYDEVLTKFFDCTPEAVAKTMWEKLQ